MDVRQRMLLEAALIYDAKRKSAANCNKNLRKSGKSTTKSLPNHKRTFR